jgi:hypothetical protein
MSPMWLYFTLVHSTPSIALPYPFTFHPHYSTAFNTYLYILYLHRCDVLWYYWCSIILFSFPSFPKIHRVVPLLQTCSTSGFVYDHADFCVYVCLLDLSRIGYLKTKLFLLWEENLSKSCVTTSWLALTFSLVWSLINEERPITEISFQ